MSDVFHMNTDLVCTTCFQTAFNISCLSKTLKYFIMCDCLFAVFMVDCHFFAVCRMTADRCIDSSFIFFEVSLHNRAITAFDAVFLELFGKVTVYDIIFADQKRTGGIFVNSVYNTWAKHSVNTG